MLASSSPMPLLVHSFYTTKSFAVFLFFLLLTLIATFSFPVEAAFRCHPDDQASLLAFKFGFTSDSSGILHTWNSSTDCCTWNGVSCRADINNRVTFFYLYGQPDHPRSFLSGTISPSLTKLQYLEPIHLINLRNLTGPLPDFFLRLPRLAYVYLTGNRLSGPIPESIGNMTQLRALGLQGNRFTGQIPSSIEKLTHLDHNRLTGTIPDFFTAFTNLVILDLSGNKLTGNIPSSVSTLFPTLRYLALGHNHLTRKIPDFLGKFRILDTLDLSWNNFSGTVPKTFVNLTKIFNLDLSHNHLVDPFPTLYVKGIESIDLSYNQFHLVNIPPWITSSPTIYSLKLAKCGLKLKLDDWKPSETYFYDYIDFSDNEITGSPFNILNNTDYLVGFYALGDKLQFDLGTLRLPKTLQFLDLSRNLVKEKVPGAVSGL
ncbi:OLC1v1022304C1 [Oldenlandia corymbosa var. corymbosa]|uniref:OLC1v1022304C1 n=1 Tax=Oldenlandia corymbosa var. corymbosa TaxID=529605 RepID=A0AAV1BXQ9_OLDCO|nr:OLC1v1022304C1 [Oldenlandia corymbosa var. corymbosa]